MDTLRNLAPWQISLIAVGVLLVFLIGGYFLVTTLTSTPVAEPPQSSIPADLGSQKNQDVVKELENFEAPEDLPLLTEPIRTPDPNGPSTVNPFE